MATVVEPEHKFVRQIGVHLPGWSRRHGLGAQTSTARVVRLFDRLEPVYCCTNLDFTGCPQASDAIPRVRESGREMIRTASSLCGWDT